MIDNFIELAEKNITKLNPKAKFILRNGEKLSAMMISRNTDNFRTTRPYILGGVAYDSWGNCGLDKTTRLDIVDYIEE